MVDVLSAYMEKEFGSAERACARLKTLINDALDHGEWHEDFDIAVKKGELDHYECARLWDAVRTAYPEAVRRMAEQVEGVKRHYESSYAWAKEQPWNMAVGAAIEWLVADDESLIVTEGLRAARFVDGSPVWVTKEISPYGIHLAGITKGEISGMGYYPTPEADDWHPFRLAFPDGALLEGQEIEFKN